MCLKHCVIIFSLSNLTPEAFSNIGRGLATAVLFCENVIFLLFVCFDVVFFIDALNVNRNFKSRALRLGATKLPDWNSDGNRNFFEVDLRLNAALNRKNFRT